MSGRRIVLAVALLAAFPGLAIAQDGTIEASDTGDTAWLLAATALLLFAALPGAALFQAGRARAGSLIAALVQTVAVAAGVSMAWIVAGYTVAFGEAGVGLIGGGNAWMLLQLGNVREGLAVPESAFAVYQIACAMLAAVLVPGAASGRARFGWLVLFTTLWSLVVLAPVTHWLWGGGWLSSSVGTLDFAGGLAIELTAGTSALVTAAIMGRGSDFPEREGWTGVPLITLLGALLLWIGWFGLCGGSAFAANDDAASALLATHAAACAGVLARLGYERLRRRPAGVGALTSGLVAGLAAIAPAALYVSTGGAIVIGAVGALLVAPVSRLVRTLGIDDRLDVFAHFAVPGATGALLLAPFLSSSLGGVGYSDGMNTVAQLAAQAIGVAAVIIWSALGATILALMASVAFPMRVSEESEAAGLDCSSHGEP